MTPLLRRTPYLLATAVVAAGALSAAAPARAQLSIVTNQSEFESAISGVSDVNFIAPPGGNYFLFDDAGLIYEGVEFNTSISGDALFFESNTIVTGEYDFGTGQPVLSFQSSPGDNDAILLGLPAGTHAVGFGFGDYELGPPSGTVPFNFEIDESSGTSFSGPITGGVPAEFTATPGFQFIGFVDPTATINDIIVTADDAFAPSIGEMQFASGATTPIPPVSVAPEPGSAALLACGAVAAAGVFLGIPRRRSQVAV
jgi:hypothetical protein